MSRIKLSFGTVAMAASGAVAGVVFATAGAHNDEPSLATDPDVVTETKDLVIDSARLTAETHKLVPVLTTKNSQGYVWQDELDLASGGAVSNPEEAKAWMDHLDELREQGVTEILIPAYQADGSTAMGQYAISISPSEPTAGIPEDELREVFADDPEVLKELLGRDG
ncbi:MAG: hypothetical protein NVV57_03215 [Demequina sp.]|jgi:hypothetical protein|nr:hypothetical protein [Demequina sp.]